MRSDVIVRRFMGDGLIPLGSDFLVQLRGPTTTAIF
jgi:hypothetical protein